MKSIRLSLIAASLLVAVSGVSLAQNAAPADPPAHAHGHKMRMHGAEHRTKHLAELQSKLQLSSQQDSAWQSFAQSMQGPADTTMRPDRAAFAKMTTPERLDWMQKMQQNHAAHLQKHAEATRLFYGQLTPEQKTIFDAQSLAHMGKMRGGMKPHPEPRH